MLLNALAHLLITSHRCSHKKHRSTQLWGQLLGKVAFATAGAAHY
jgi:hypothetical protein